MKVGELVAEVRFKNVDRAVSSLKIIKGALGGITSETFAALSKVSGLVGAFAGLAYITSKAGASLQQYSNLTGLSTDKLQDLQYAMRKAGVSADETASSVVSLFEKFSDPNFATGDAPRAWLGQIATWAHAADEEVVAGLKNPEKFIEILRRAAQEAKRLHQEAAFLTFSKPYISQSFAQGLLSPGLAKQPGVSPFRLSPAQQAADQKTIFELENLSIRLSRITRGILVPLIPEIEKLSIAFLHMVSALDKFGEQSGVFKLLVTAMEGLTAALDLLSGKGVVKTLKDSGLADNKYAQLKDTGTDGLLKKLIDPIADFIVTHFLLDIEKAVPRGGYDEHIRLLLPAGIDKRPGQHVVPPANNTIINQNIQAPDPVTAGKHAANGVNDVMRRQTAQAYRGNPTLGVHS